MKKYYLPLLKNYKRYLIISPILVLIYVFCETAQPMLMGTIIDEGVMKKEFPIIIQTGGMMILLSLLAIAASISNLFCASKTSSGFAADIRERLFHQIQQFAFADIDQFSTPSLITRMSNDTTVLQQVIQRSMLLLYRAPLMMIVAFFFVIKIDAYIAGFIAIAIPILGVSILFLLKKGYPLFIKLQQKLDDLNRVVRENLINIKVVKSFVREDMEKEKFRSANFDYRDTAIRAINIIIVVIPLMQLIMNLLILSILWIGGIKNAGLGIEIGKLISLVNYSLQILMALMMVSMTIVMFARASASSERILEVLKTEPSIADKPPALSESGKITKGEIIFDNVCFKYNLNSDRRVLKNINFTIHPGENIAIAGGTGSAKSTLIQLIPRLYDATEGKVIIDGVDVKEYPLEVLRNNIGVVQQKNELFSGSIMENLRWGDPEASDEEIIEVAKIAEAHDFITQFPKQYDTLLGRGGVNLSGGQKQRLCIARALLKRPKILLMDNSTSAVDMDTEQKIKNNLRKQFKDTTLLIVTQRLSSMEDSNRIIILEDGRVEGIGKAEELLEKSTVYREIHNSQSLLLS